MGTVEDVENFGFCVEMIFGPVGARTGAEEVILSSFSGRVGGRSAAGIEKVPYPFLISFRHSPS